MVQKRYEVVVKNGNKIVERVWEDDYDVAQDKLDDLEDRFSDRYKVEFTDHKLFSGKFKS